MVRLIGVAGAFGSGKDTAADVLVNRYGFVKTHMADPLKLEVYDALIQACNNPESPLHGMPGYSEMKPHPVDPNLPDADKIDWINEYKPELRQLLQTYGTEYRRAQDPNYWIQRTEAFLNAASTPVVISDIRFPNEAELIRRRGGLLWCVRREVAEHGTDITRGHVSEEFCHTWTDWDRVLYNNAKISWLEQLVSAAWNTAISASGNN